LHNTTPDEHHGIFCCTPDASGPGARTVELGRPISCAAPPPLLEVSEPILDIDS